jgi:hypothetical protein
MPVLGAVFSETMMAFIAQGIREGRLNSAEKERVVFQGELDRIRKRKAQLLKLGDLEDPDIAEAFNALKEEEVEIHAKMAALPVTAGEDSVSIREVYRVMNGDPIALTKTLQAGGYRIVCDAAGVMVAGAGANATRWVYLGYNRKGKTHIIQTPDGREETAGAMVSSSGGGYHEAPEGSSYYDVFPEEREVPTEADYQDHLDEELVNLPPVSWGKARH